MSISSKLRFEVFKRDGFTCRYCGKKTPAVVLEVDHIIPRSKGGEDEIENLATACFACNRGKGAGLLENHPEERDMHEEAILLAEREMQLAEYNEIKLRSIRRIEDEADKLFAYFMSSVRCSEECSDGNFPMAMVISTLRIAAFSDIYEYIDKACQITENGTARRCHCHCYCAGRYLFGILRNIIKESKS